MGSTTGALSWPALQFDDRDIPSRIAFEEGVWGKIHGSPSDFRWIATTRAFSGETQQVERRMPLGAEDEPLVATLWRVIEGTCYAVALYPSQAHDAAGRSGFIEKRILEWVRAPEVPATLGALFLLPAAAQVAPKEPEQRSEIRWSDDDAVELENVSPISVSPTSLESAVEEGLALLTAATTEEALAELYAGILAGGRALPLRGLVAPLPPRAMAALLLPLPRSVADRLSIAGWLPSSRVSDSGAEEVRSAWELVLGGDPATATSVTPSDDQLAEARAMAKDVFARRSRSDALTFPAGIGSDTPDVSTAPIQLALWGPSAAGKTVLLGKLYLDGEDDETQDEWDVLPTARSLAFIRNMRARMRTSNLFPRATPFHHVDGLEYSFRHRKTGIEASLYLEDRAGRESEEIASADPTHTKSLHSRLRSADGLVLLFDLLSDVSHRERLFLDTLDFLHVSAARRTRRDTRPTAVCISKADMLIQSSEDYRRALERPDEFVRERAPASMIAALDKYYSNYRLFPVSAAGIRLRHGAIEPVVFFDENLDLRICPGGRPFNVLAPFRWLLSELRPAS